MALIFCDGFDHYGNDDFNKKWNAIVGAGSTTTISGTNQKTGTGCLKFHDSDVGYWGNDGSLIKNFASNYQTMVIGCAINVTVNKDSYYYFKFYDLTTLQFNVQITSSYMIEVYRGTTKLGTSSIPICSLEENFYFEIKIYIHDTTGYVTIRKNGTDFYSLTDIDTKNTSNAYVNAFQIGYSQSSYGTGTAYIDDLYVDSANFLGDIKVETLYPSGAGTTKQWDASAGDNYECVDETPLNSDTDYVSTLTADEIDTYAFDNLTTTAGTVYGVQVNIIARKDDAGSRSIAPVVRPASTDRVGTTQSIGDSYMDYIQMYVVNPEDSAAWEIADVNGAEFGVKLIE